MDLHQYFEFKEKGKTIMFKETNEDGLICYNCGKKYKKIIVHLSIKENCRGNINIGQLKIKYNEYRRSKLLQRHRDRQRKYMNKLREELGSSNVKQDQNARTKKCIDKKREQIGNTPVKKDQNARKKNCIDKKRVKLGPIQLNQELKERQQKYSCSGSNCSVVEFCSFEVLTKDPDSVECPSEAENCIPPW